MNKSMSNYSDKLSLIKEKTEQADAVVIGAGDGDTLDRYRNQPLKKFHFGHLQQYVCCRIFTYSPKWTMIGSNESMERPDLEAGRNGG